jgi:CRP-like cAMP-binding protein
METLRRREHFLLDEIEQISLQNATQRVMAYLLHHAGEAESANRVTLNIPKHILASRLTIKPETLSRVLARLKGKGFIRLKGEVIMILDRKTLEVENRCFLCGGRSWGCPGPGLEI